IYLDITGFLSAVKSAKKPVDQLVSQIRSSVLKELQESFPTVAAESSLGEALLQAAAEDHCRFFFIIDEWDAIFREETGDLQLQEAYIDFLREIFKNGNVTDAAVAGAYMTGILPIKKYGHQSAISDFREYSMMEPGAFAEYVGFTEAEVKEICKESGLSFEECRNWYDGYSFSQENSVYNPNSVMCAAEVHYCDSFWARTETYESLHSYIDADFDGLQAALIQLLGGAEIPLNITTFQNDMTTFRNKDDILSLLVHLGYLSYWAKSRTVRIPNLEIRKEFKDTLAMSSHTETARLIMESDQLIEDTIEGNEDVVAKALDRAHDAGTAPLFYNNEQALRAVIKAAYISAVNDYAVIEELPSGRGYADIVYLPTKQSSKPPMVIELKWNKSADSAIQQIKQKHYPDVLRNVHQDILLVGVAYDPKTRQHQCRIEKVKAPLT
ncbi:MAG: AAA family ATPase, partial [Eubacterium sp.]